MQETESHVDPSDPVKALLKTLELDEIPGANLSNALDRILLTSAEDDGAKLFSEMHADRSLCDALTKTLFRYHSEDRILCSWFSKVFDLPLQQAKLFVHDFIPAFLWAYNIKQAAQLPSSGLSALLFSMYSKEKLCYQNEGNAKSVIPEADIPDLFSDSLLSKAHSHDDPGVSLLIHNDFNLEDISFDYFPETKLGSKAAKLSMTRAMLGLYVFSLFSMSRWSYLRFCAFVAYTCGSGTLLADISFVEELKDSILWEFVPLKTLRRKRFQVDHLMLLECFEGVKLLLTVERMRDLAINVLKVMHARASEDLCPEIMLPTTCLLEELQS